MSVGFKGVWLFHCLKIKACSENTRTVSRVEVQISSWISCPLQHAEHPQSKNHRNYYSTPEEGFYLSSGLLSSFPFVELSCWCSALLLPREEADCTIFAFSIQIFIQINSCSSCEWSAATQAKLPAFAGDRWVSLLQPLQEQREKQTEAIKTAMATPVADMVALCPALRFPTGLSLGNWLNQLFAEQWGIGGLSGCSCRRRIFRKRRKVSRGFCNILWRMEAAVTKSLTLKSIRLKLLPIGTCPPSSSSPKVLADFCAAWLLSHISSLWRTSQYWH